LSDQESSVAQRDQRSLFWLFGLLIAALVSPLLLDSSTREWLRYERTFALNGEYWRLVSAHFVHGSTQHLLLNLGGLIAIAALFKREYSAQAWLLVLVLSIVVIDLGFVFYQPQLQWYVGFSGVLHGALAAGAMAWWRSESGLAALALSLILIGKLTWEQWHGALPLSGDLPVVVDAHLYGAIGGLVAASILWAVRQPWFSRLRSL
jgi:rhomboid family GlyGly-CTERM serine protease